MALKVRDRVKETTTTTGTGTITLGGAVTGFRTFSSVLSDNDTTYYAIVGDTQFEVGLGTYSSNTLARTTVLSSSNSNSAVSFSTGTKNVFITQPSGKAVFRDASGNIAELTTANLSENTNLYFTNERVDDRVASLLQNGTGISFTYNDSSNTLTPVISLSSFDTDNLSEGSSNLYHTTERVQDIVGAMFSSNTETGITVSYEDSDGTIDLVVATQSDNNFTTTLLNKLNAIESNATADQTASEIRTLVESASDSNVFTDADHSKLDGIEASATADQTAAEIRTLVESASDSNVFTDADHTKLNGIEASATADQSDSEIKTAYENNSDTNAFTDALLSKLNAIESGATADQTSEEIQDIVGAMFSSNTETGITATYQDSDGTIDLVVSLSSFDTDNLSEGSSNLYYTDARVNSFLTTNSYATQSFVNTAISNLVDSAPSTLDTLNELAAALGDDANFSTTTATSLGNRLRIDVSNQGLTSTQKTNALTNLGINSEYSGNSATATALATARTIHGVSFDGTANIDLSEVIQDTVGAMFSGNTETNITATYEDSDGTIDLVVATLNQDTTGNSATATALETARTIHGVSFDGTANIDLSEVIQDTVGAMFSSNTETGITATYEDSDGTIDLVVATQTANDFTTTLKNKLDGIEASATADQSDSEIKTAYENNSDTNAFTDALLSKLNGIEANATADQTAEEIQDIVGAMFSSNTETGITATYQDSDGTIDLVVGTLNQDTTGNSATATALETARTIHGVSFDGTSNIDLSEVIQDTVGAMFSSNTETGITATYQDADGTIDLVVATLNQDTTGNSATATALETARTIHGVSFDGTANIDLTEVIQDTVGAMFSSNTETDITATYQDSDGTIDLVVSGGGTAGIDSSAGSTAMTIDSSLRVLVGTTTGTGTFGVNTGSAGVNFAVATQPAGSIYFGNSDGSTKSPTLSMKTDDSSSRNQFRAFSNNGSTVDLQFMLGEHDDSDFASTTGQGFLFTRYGTDLMQITRNGNMDLGFSSGVGTGDGNPAFRVTQGSTSFNGNLIQIQAKRSSSSAFSLIQAYSNFASDPKFKVRGDGEVSADGSFSGGGADYGEYFEWEDGNPNNEDRIGCSVSIHNNKIKVAEEGENIIGVVSGNPAVIGDAQELHWHDKYLKDDYGRIIEEEYTAIEWEESISNGTDIPKTERHSYHIDRIPSDLTPPENADIITEDINGKLKRPKLNQNYDESLDYIPRSERQEWSCIGLVGKLRINKDQIKKDNWIKMGDISDSVEEWLIK